MDENAHVAQVDMPVVAGWTAHTYVLSIYAVNVCLVHCTIIYTVISQNLAE